MGKCEFSLKFQGSKQQLIEKIQSEIQNARGTISVQKDSGSFNIPLIMGKIEGLFHFQEDQVLVEITEKPFVLSCSKIEAEIAKYLSR